MESEIKVEQNSLDEQTLVKDISCNNSSDESWITASYDDTDNSDNHNVVNRRSGLFSITHILKNKNKVPAKSALDTNGKFLFVYNV